jgi:hypothetical protein
VATRPAGREPIDDCSTGASQTGLRSLTRPVMRAAALLLILLTLRRSTGAPHPADVVHLHAHQCRNVPPVLAASPIRSI